MSVTFLIAHWLRIVGRRVRITHRITYLYLAVSSVTQFGDDAVVVIKTVLVIKFAERVACVRVSFMGTHGSFA